MCSGEAFSVGTDKGCSAIGDTHVDACEDVAVIFARDGEGCAEEHVFQHMLFDGKARCAFKVW